MERILAHNSYFAKRVGALALIFVVIQMFLRVSLLVWEYNEISLSLAEFLEMLAVGLVYDAATFSYFMIAYVFYVAILPSSLHLKKIDVVITSVIYFALLYLLLFDVVAEWVFWDEFSVRFNFIAVDYLVYTQEVLENIWQSYHVVSILIAVALTALVTYYVTKHMLLPRLAGRIMPFRVRLAYAIAYLLVPLSFFFFMDLNKAEVTTNNYANEITKNGVYSLFSAFFNNEISYEKFYLSGYGEAELPPIRTLLEENELGQYFIGNDADDITRFVPSQVTEKKKNVIIVVMESMSAEYMEHFGNEEKITPNLDRLADSAIFFEKTYATGTRTVRGLEAISLSVPPSAGRSIIKKKGNEELASIGYVFKDKGYDTRFIYGGYGYFDNMNYFFSHNGFDIVDRNDFESAEQHFANAWGVSDEDLFTKVIKVADASYEQKKPFMHMVMTTSNHRPYTFPENIAVIPTRGGGRPAGGK